MMNVIKKHDLNPKMGVLRSIFNFNVRILRNSAIVLAATVVAAFNLAAPARAGGLVYAPTGGANEVVIIDTNSDKIVGIIKDVIKSHGLSGSATGKYLVAGRFGETGPSQSIVSVISIKDGVVAHRIKVPGATHHTAVTPNGYFSVVTQPNNDTVSILDLRDFKLLKTIKAGPGPNYVIASGDGKNVYVSNSAGKTVSEIDTKSWTIKRNMTAGEDPGHMVLSLDGKTLYVNNGTAGTITAVSLKSGAISKTFKVGGDLHGIDLFDNGKKLIVSDIGGDRLISVNLDNGKKHFAAIGPAPLHVMTIPGSDKFYVSSMAKKKIWVVDSKSLKTKKEIKVPGKAHQMVFIGN